LSVKDSSNTIFVGGLMQFLQGSSAPMSGAKLLFASGLVDDGTLDATGVVHGAETTSGWPGPGLETGRSTTLPSVQVRGAGNASHCARCGIDGGAIMVCIGSRSTPVGNGVDFTPWLTVPINWDCSASTGANPVLLDTAVADSNGNFALLVTIPAAPGGSRTVSGQAPRAGRSG